MMKMHSEFTEHLFRLTKAIIIERGINLHQLMKGEYIQSDILYIVQAACLFLTYKPPYARTILLSALFRKTIKFCNLRQSNISGYVERSDSDDEFLGDEDEIIAYILHTAYLLGWLDAKYAPTHWDDEYEESGAEYRDAFSAYSSVDPIENITGAVYFIKDIEASHLYKIGFTTHWHGRSATFAVKLPFRWELTHLIYCTDFRFAERIFHLAFEHKRMNGEWFDLQESDLALVKTGNYFRSAELKEVMDRKKKS